MLFYKVFFKLQTIMNMNISLQTQYSSYNQIVNMINLRKYQKQNVIGGRIE